MQVFHAPAEMTAWAETERLAGRKIALVPTMGSFHEGHLSLMRLAAGRVDHVVVSLFVNPMQFGPQEDFAQYPRDVDRDLALARQAGATVVFAPTPNAMYPAGFQTQVSVETLSLGLCGASRPGHFTGVTTVVAKLFNIVGPHLAIFGEKDFQQLAVIRRMVIDLAWNIEIIGHPVVRESDGLAMSSRNVYLAEDERRRALCLFQGLQLARQQVKDGVDDALLLTKKIEQMIASHPGVTIEYIRFIHGDDLTEQKTIDEHTRLVLAVRVGVTRLIDNGLVFELNSEC